MARAVTARSPLLVDKRRGSAELARRLKSLGAPVVLDDLRFHDEPKSGPDFQWEGYGPTGRTPIGVERKRVSEILEALTDTRFTAGQLPNMVKTFHPWAYLVVEGDIRPGPRGELQAAFVVKEWTQRRGGTRQLIIWSEPRWAGRFGYGEFTQFLMTASNKAGLRLVMTRDAVETCQWLYESYRWWQKPWDSHRSINHLRSVRPDAAMYRKQTPVAIVSAQFPDVYWERSKLCDHEFRSVVDMVTATRAEWAALIGPNRGRKVWRWLRGLKVQGMRT